MTKPDPRFALTRKEFEEISAEIGKAPKQEFLTRKPGETTTQISLPWQWVHCLQATIEYGFREEQAEAA